MHDLLFRNQQTLALPDLRKHAWSLGLPEAGFDECLNGQAVEQVRADVETAKALQVSGTPTFFIGTLEPNNRVKVIYRFSGAQPLAHFEKLLDRVLSNVVAGSDQRR
jgi:protein-disulfide isomerase